MQGEQVYVTHCQPADSINNRPGFEVRASSTTDTELHHFAVTHPAYELPLDMRRQEPTADEAPRRLALTPAPGGRVALVHTVHVPEDTCGRRNSFFSHVLFLDTLTLRQALSTWASPDWRLEHPPGGTKKLAAPTGLPRSGPLDDASLAAFLKVETNRRLLRRTMMGVRLVLRASEDDPRGRFYIRGRPELVAQLLYGVARLLPEARDAVVPFSTYESAHRVLREYRLARIVGTFTAERPLDEHCFVRGYGLDVGEDRRSPELDDAPPLFDTAMELAAKGQWQELEMGYSYLGASASRAATLKPALETLRAVRRLSEGKCGPDDLAHVLRLAQGTDPARIVTAFSLLRPIPTDDEELKKSVACWLKVVEGDAEPEALHRMFVERCVPTAMRDRVASTLIKSNLAPTEPPAQPRPRRRWNPWLTHGLAFAAGAALVMLVMILLRL